MVIPQAIINALVIISPIFIMGIMVLVDALAQWQYNKHIDSNKEQR
jgi:amino acid transporter